MIDDSRDWLDRAESATDPDVEIFFAIRPTFYVGDPNDPAQIGNPKFEVPLPVPAIGDGTVDALSTKAVLGRERELAAHYRAVVERAKEAGQRFDDIRTHFWMRLWIGWKGGDLAFPWYDGWKEMEDLLGWIETAEDGAHWWDADQGWELTALRKGPLLCFRMSDGREEEHAAVRIDREALLAQAHALRGRISAIIRELSSLLGADVWTEYRHDEVIFGSGDWRP
jgi:hypothetical protein